MTERNENETVEGMVWPIVLLVELPAVQAEALTKELEGGSTIVMVEGSMLRAAQQVRAQRPDVVVAPASLEASERTQVLRDAAREIGLAVMFVPAETPSHIVVAHVREELQRGSQAKIRARRSRST